MHRLYISKLGLLHSVVIAKDIFCSAYVDTAFGHVSLEVVTGYQGSYRWELIQGW